jgi:hypothetical protein
MDKVCVVTATVGNPILARNIESVAKQTHTNIQHLVMIDGPERFEAVDSLLYGVLPAMLSNVTLVTLPYSIGKDRWNGHRIYAASTFMADCDYIIYLDDDNTLEPTHIEECLATIKSGKDWSFSFRNIVNKQGEFLCKDNCESLGKWASVIDPRDYFVDVNCYFMPIRLAVQITPVWYRKFREPGQMEIDRAMCHVLRQIAPNYDATYNYTVNYTVGNSEHSVQAGFFEAGNAEMLRRYNGNLPWSK